MEKSNSMGGVENDNIVNNNTSSEKNFLKSFCIKKMNNTSEKNYFLDNIFGSSNISSELKGELEKEYISGNIETKSVRGKYNTIKSNKYGIIDVNKITITELQDILRKDHILLQIKRNQLNELFKNDLLNTTELFDNNIYEKIKGLNDSEISKLFDSQKSRKDFLNSIDNKILFKDNNLSLLLNIDLDTISDEGIKIIKSIQSKVKNNIKIKESEIKDFLTHIYLDINTKKKIIEILVPYISLENAILWGLKTKEEAVQYKKIIFKSNGLDEDEIENIISSVDNKGIFISTNRCAGLNFQIDYIIRNIDLTGITTDINSIIDHSIEETKNNGPQTLDILKSELSDINKEGRFNHLEKFSEGNIMKISKKNEKGEEEITYIKILKTDNDKKELTFLEVGKGKIINLYQDGEGNKVTYLEFFNNLKNSSINLDFFTKKEINEQIKDPNNNELDSSDLEFFTSDDINNASDEQKEEYKRHYKDNLEKDLELLKDELEQKNVNKGDEPLLEARIEDLESQIGDIDNLNDTELLNFLNFQKLIEKIDLIDPDRKSLGFKKGIIFETKAGIYEIVGIDKENQTIHIKSSAGKEEASFEDFYQAFKSEKPKRQEKINDFSEILKGFEDGNSAKFWKNHELIDGVLIAKGVENGDEIGNEEVEYFVSDKDDSIIKIDNISGDKITVQFGERKKRSSLDKKDKNYSKDDEGEVLYINGAEKQTLSLNEFNKIISDEAFLFRPSWETGKELKAKKAEDIQNDIKGNGVTRFFDRMSINEVIAGGKMFIEGIEESMKRGNDLHAAKVALAMGSILPEEIRAELQIKVERQEAEEMDKALEGLGKVDSGEAVKRIKSWLLNKDTPEFKKEAGLMFMVSKYGLLYAKGAMGPMKGTYLWYEALGGRKNDKLFLEVKKESEAENVPFTEENLIFILLNKQCKGGFNGIKRRGRLYKEYDGKISQGISDELEKGSREAKAMRTYETRNEKAKDEFMGGEFNNGLGKYKEAVNRGSDLHNLNELPFILLFSGAGYLFQEEQLNEFKNFTEGAGFGGLLFTKFLSDTIGMDIFNNTILKLSEQFEKEDPEHFKGMLDEANSIFKIQKDGTKKLATKMENAESFWGKYGKALTRTMLKLNNQDETYSKTDKLLIINNEDFSEYNNILETYIGPADFSNEGIMNDQFAEQGISGLGYKVFDDIGGLSADARFRNNEAAEKILNEITSEIHNTKSFNYSNDKNKNSKIKLLNLERQLSFLFTYIKKNGGQSKTMQNMKEGSSYWGEFSKLGISNYIDRLGGNEFSINNLSKLDTPEVRSFIRGVAENILFGNIESSNVESSSLFNEIISGTKDATNKTVS